MPVLAGDECLFSGNLGTDTDRLKLAAIRHWRAASHGQRAAAASQIIEGVGDPRRWGRNIDRLSAARSKPEVRQEAMRLASGRF